MADVVRIFAPRPSLIPLFFSALCIGAAGFLLPPQEGLDPAFIAYLLSSLLAFTVGLVHIYVVVSGVPLRPVHAELLTKVVAASSIAALLLAPPPGRLKPAGTPAPVHDLVTGHPKRHYKYNLSPARSPEVAENTVFGHPESLIVSNASFGSPVEAVPNRVTGSGSPMPSFVRNTLIGNTNAMDAVCAVPSLPNIALLLLFCEMGNRGEGVKEVI
ncbi:hypothetical protein COCNU_03G004410 [Cocos nucifera]|uniref:Uncharacterized protein n=1 Tax=Cocos nucifera TaxID=13894 RepID=A0A8K0I1W5_COCNU|nr:hypothetical protein COCNU_03G004410 [Cocos nucifera]